MTMPIPLQIMFALFNAALAIVGTLLLINFKQLGKSMDSHETRIATIEEDVKVAVGRKDRCRQDFVDKVDYIREVTKLDNNMCDAIKLISEIKGSMSVIEQMPKICGNIASQIVKEMRNQNNG